MISKIKSAIGSSPDYDHVVPDFSIPLTTQDREAILHDFCKRYKLDLVLKLEEFQRRGLMAIPNFFEWWIDDISTEGRLEQWAIEERDDTTSY